MEYPPADARAAPSPSASGPNDVVMDIASSPKRPRDPAQDNKLAPHRLYYVLARLLTPPKGVWEGPRAVVHLPRNT
eukprot:scaffold4297_cov103-Isochrysis_galbana.AAC.8